MADFPVPNSDIERLAKDIPTLKHFSGFAAWKKKLSEAAESFGAAGHLGDFPSIPNKDTAAHTTWQNRDHAAIKLIISSVSLRDRDNRRIPDPLDVVDTRCDIIMDDITQEVKLQEIDFFKMLCTAVSLPSTDDHYGKLKNHLEHLASAWDTVISNTGGGKYLFKLFLFTQIWLSPGYNWSSAEICFCDMEDAMGGL